MAFNHNVAGSIPAGGIFYGVFIKSLILLEMARKRYNYGTLLYILIFIIILIYIVELDRNFNGMSFPTKKFYYIDAFPLPILGLYNTFIRTTNPSHTHVFNPEIFQSTRVLEANWKSIQNESLKIYEKKDKLRNMTDIGVMGNFTGIDAEKGKWKVFVLKWYDKELENAKRQCPETVSLLNKCPDVHAAMFSILEPGKYIPPHKGPSTGCLRYHIGLKIPKDKENCYITVNNEKYIWEEGKSMIFDDTYVHSVYNNTDEPRIILFMDIERPLASPMKEINHYLCKNGKYSEFVKGVNDVSEKTKELFHNYTGH